METKMKNQMKLNQSGSLVNFLMGNNATLPKVGEGATILMYSDRHAYEVLAVSKDYKRVVIQRYAPERVDKNGMSESQDYAYKTLEGSPITIVWRNNAWKIEGERIEFCKKWTDTLPKYDSYTKHLTEEQKQFIYDDDCEAQNVLEGITELKKVYSKVNIIFGVKREYYDFSF